MRESSLVPTNLLNWPRICGLLPEEKLIIQSLWSAPFLSLAGVGELPTAGFAATLGLSQESLKRGMSNLVEIGVIMLDTETAEVFVTDWFRFHKFNSKTLVENLKHRIEKVRSEHIKNVIIDKSKTWLLTPTLTTTLTTTTPTPTPTITVVEAATPPVVGVVEEEVVVDIEEYVKANLWIAKKAVSQGGRAVFNEVSYKAGIRKRLKKDGVEESDKEALAAFHIHISTVQAAQATVEDVNIKPLKIVPGQLVSFLKNRQANT